MIIMSITLSLMFITRSLCRESGCSSVLRGLTLDVTSEAAIAEAARAVTEAEGERGLYGLINNAGQAGRPPPVRVLMIEY
jgi:NAD(P)-dependent dehydrogenase (short-subunit alcohol dehydrogenase family)